MKKKVFLFDFDGTLVDSLPMIVPIYYRFLESFGKQGDEEGFAEVNGPNLKWIAAHLKKKYDLPGTEEELYHKYRQIITEVYPQVEPIEGARELLQFVKEKQGRIGIVTSNFKETVKTWLAKQGLSSFIEEMVTFEEVAQGKPHPESFLKALEKFQCRPEEAIVIEDAPKGVQAALAAQIPAYLLAETASEELRSNSLFLGNIPKLKQVKEKWAHDQIL